MPNKFRFSFLMRPGEAAALKRIAESMDRSQGAALRTLIRKAEGDLKHAGLLTADMLAPSRPQTHEGQYVND